MLHAGRESRPSLQAQPRGIIELNYRTEGSTTFLPLAARDHPLPFLGSRVEERVGSALGKRAPSPLTEPATSSTATSYFLNTNSR